MNNDPSAQALLPSDYQDALDALSREVVTTVDANFPSRQCVNTSRTLVGFICDQAPAHKAKEFPDIIKSALTLAAQPSTPNHTELGAAIKAAEYWLSDEETFMDDDMRALLQAARAYLEEHKND